MGQTKKASALFDQVIEKVKNREMTDEVRVIFLLRRAELLAQGEDVGQRQVLEFMELFSTLKTFIPA
jgi:hypothetical protein